MPSATATAVATGTTGDNPATSSRRYEVQAAGFEGPFDLLLHLILKEDVDIYEVSLAEIVNGYLAYLDRLEGMDLEVTTEFLLIAATLVELKSRRLLPVSDEMDLDEELALWEERDLLLHRLVECKTFKEAARSLQTRVSEAGRCYPRRLGPDERFSGLMPDLLAGVAPEGLRRAYLAAIAPKPVPKVDMDHVAPIRASVTDALTELAAELPRMGRVSFRRLTGDLVERLEVVVRFLALLELFKRGLVELAQVDVFGEITIDWIGPENAATALEMDDADAYEG